MAEKKKNTKKMAKDISEGENATVKKAEPSPTKTGGKDPAIAALIALAGGLILGFPGGGYIYIDKMKKGLIYGLGNWALALILFAISFAIYTGITIVSFGLGAVCFPVMLLPAPLVLIYFLLVIYDTYLDAKGEKTYLPEI